MVRVAIRADLWEISGPVGGSRGVLIDAPPRPSDQPPPYPYNMYAVYFLFSCSKTCTRRTLIASLSSHVVCIMDPGVIDFGFHAAGVLLME